MLLLGLPVGNSLPAVLALLASLIFAFAPAPASAHGGLSMDEDMCRLTLGIYNMHFSGYQPRQTGSIEFCEDIPKTGQVVVSMDMMDDALRRIPVSVRIIRDTGDDTQLEQSTVLYLEPKLYPNGSVSFEHNFPEAGKFVGLVTAGENGEYTSVFPFSVGIPKIPYGMYSLILLIIGLGYAFYKYSGRNRQAA